MQFIQYVSKWDKLIREGQGALVVAQVINFSKADVPENFRPQVAAIMRRLGLFKNALELLRDDFLVCRETFLSPHASRSQEALMTEYAALLTEIGATQISEKILSHYQKPQIAMTLFYRSLLWIKKWEYEKAAVDLRLFKGSIDDPYWKNLADLNLLGALVFLREWSEASQILKSLEAQSSYLSPMAAGVLSELKGQFLFFSGYQVQAKNHFLESYERLKSTHNPSLIFAEKWILICDLLAMPWDQVQDRFYTFQKHVRTLGYWEVVRELDRFYALKFSSEVTLRKLYFGSPAEGYKRMICRDLGWTPPTEYFYGFSGTNEEASNYLDVTSLELHISGTKISRIPQTSLLLLKALTSDLYRPMAVGSLFEQIYQGQYFDPSFASQRVHQSISRFRKFANEHDIRLKISSSELGYTLLSDSNFSIRYVEKKEKSALPVPILRLIESFGDKSFSAAEAAQSLSLSQRTVNRMLSQQIEEGFVIKSGSGSRVQYRVKKAA